MTAERTRALVGECISRAHVEAARGAALEDIHAACAACDYERAATLVFGRARAGEPVPFETIARLLPGIELPQVTMALVAITKERARLVELVERKRFPQTKDASELEVIALYAAWRAGADTARIIPELRRLSARQMSVESYALLATIAATIDDANVATATKPIAAFAKEYAKQVAADDKAMTGSVDAAIASLPAEVQTAATAGFTVRAVKQAGRNDPCPCGSGLKFKKCCADKPAAHEAKPSPVPGVSWDEFLAGDRMTSAHVEELPLRDLVRVDFGKLAAEPLIAAFRRFLLAREWDHAERVVEATRDELRVGPPDELRDGLRDELREELVHNLLDSGERERARAQIAKLPTDGAKLFELDAAIAEGPAAAWPALVRAAREAATDKLPALELAYSLLRAEPALGILAARACIGALNIDDPELMLDLVEEARDQLNIAPNDPAWEVLEELMVDEKPDIDEGVLRESLAESSARVGELERALAAVQTQLASERTRPAAELVRHAGDRDRLDDKVRELEALIREGQAERRDLRKQLEAAATAEDSSRREGPRARRPTVEEDDDDGGESVEPGARGIAIPRFERRAIDALGSVPATVASETMRTVGTLAAGDGFAWRGVKAARDMVRQVLMARVGIHHRVLFRVEDGHLDVIDLITREQLLTTLKRLRANR